MPTRTSDATWEGAIADGEAFHDHAEEGCPISKALADIDLTAELAD